MKIKHYVSPEAAKKLKELGYRYYESVYDCSVNGDVYLNTNPVCGDWMNDKDVYPAPTLLEAMDWLESKDIHVEIRMQHCKVKGDPYKIADDDEYQWKYFFAICKGSDVMNPIVEADKDGYVILHTDRNECMQKLIEKALELL